RPATSTCPVPTARPMSRRRRSFTDRSPWAHTSPKRWSTVATSNGLVGSMSQPYTSRISCLPRSRAVGSSLMSVPRGRGGVGRSAVVGDAEGGGQEPVGLGGDGEVHVERGAEVQGQGEVLL